MGHIQKEETTSSSYFLPVNETEAERLMAQHLVLIDALDGRIILPRIDFTRSGLNILDSGTADGMYATVSCGREQEKGRRLLTNSALRTLDQRAPQDTS